ncbi:sortase domain-bontaining protein [Streptomyces albidoflavus]|uniref:sortase domain-containing protein n=1 Tax=Streptomyces albidoflavus TaxID=1886 RepID=UPI00101E685A|nr:sortase [Streptomyces albidoflavus]RZE86864.1 class F sortase [Streptomyces albidoflavus]RZE87847.1 class F sortase [Streptomyces albidoflavus]
MTEPRPFDRLGPPSWPAPWGILVLLLLAGLALIRNGSGEFDSGPPQPAPAAATGARSPAAPPGTAGAAPAALPASPAVRVRVPGAGVDAPGTRGTSVLVGRVDEAEGPAVFHGLGAVAKGGRVEVARADGRAAVFTVYGVDVVPKKDFPARRVYGDTGRPELRLITCGGTCRPAGGYDANVVVFARLGAVT